MRFAAGAVVLLLVAFAMRGPLAAPGVVARQIETGLDVPPAAVGLVSSLPLLCFAVATPLAAHLVTRLGVDRTVTVTLAAITCGLVLRVLGSYEWLVAGTLIVGIAITLGNVAMPVYARASIQPDRQSAFTGAYVASASVGSMASTVGTAVVAGAAGWQAALAASAPVAMAAVGGWSWYSHRAGAPGRRELRDAGDNENHAAEDETRSLWRDPRWRRITVVLVCAFSAQAFLYFSFTAWLPAILLEHAGLSLEAAAATASVFQLLGVAGALGLPPIVRRWGSVSAAGMVSVAWMSTVVGLLAFPAASVLWLAFGGVAHAGAFVVIFGGIIQYRGGGPRSTAAMSATVQGVGYAVAATGPVLIGGLSEWSGSWVPALALLIACAGVFAACAVTAMLSMTNQAARATPHSC